MSFQKGKIYTWNGTVWNETTESQAVAAAFKDALQLARDSGELIEAAFAIVHQLYANNVTAGIPVTGLEFNVLTYDTNGDVLAEPIWEVKYQGNKIFEIEATSGDMFFGDFNEEGGSGLRWNNGLKRLESKDDKLIINTDGTIEAIQAKLIGAKIDDAEVIGTLRTGDDAPQDARVGIRESVGIIEGPTHVGTGLDDLSVIQDGSEKVTVRVKIETVAPLYDIGDTGPGGGLIFYKVENVCYELAPSGWYNGDDPKFEWGGYGTLIGTSVRVGMGKINTEKTVTALGAGTYAAKICDDLTFGGKNDWFLPSSGELTRAYNNLHVEGLGGFLSGNYHSSSELSSDAARAMRISDGAMLWIWKDDECFVRPVRSFILADTFKVSVDDGDTYGSEIAISANRQYTIPDTGIIIEFGSYTEHTAGDYWRMIQDSMHGLRIVDSENIEYFKASGGFVAYKPPFFHAQHQTDGNGGTLASGAWTLRPINTVVENTISGASLNTETNIITLPAGEYYIEASVCAYRVNRHRAYLYNQDDSEIILLGTSEMAVNASTSAATWSRILGRINLSVITDMSIQHRCTNSRSNDGMGAGTTQTWAHPHIFGEIKIWKIK